VIDIFDLALQKVVDDRGPYLPGELVEFKFSIYNQGNVEATDIVITDYLNTGFTFTPGGANTGWTAVGNNAEYIYAGPLAAGDLVTISIFLEITIPTGASLDSWINEGEISSASGEDADSVSDNNPDNDNDVTPGSEKDDEVNEHANGEDEDDNDVADVLVTGEIGDKVWKDDNYDGIQDSNEPGIEGVVVSLYDCNGGFIRETTTDASGNYLFDLLLPGEYRLSFDISNLPGDCSFTYQNQGAEDLDSDADVNGNTTCFTLEAGQNNYDIDVGLLRLACIGNFVWHDLDGDGIQDGGEPGIANVLVRLYDERDSIIDQTQTDETGNYLFDRLYPGEYYLEFVTPNQYPLVTDANQGSDTDLDSNIDHSNGQNTTPIVTLTGDGNCDLSWDAGFFDCVPIGDFVWYDLDRNNIADLNENGINGLEIQLFRRVNGTWRLWDSQFTGYKPGTTSDDGYFKFCAPPGEYHLKANIPSYGLVLVDAHVGSDDNVDSDFDGSNGPSTSETFSVICGGEKCDLAAGFYTESSVGSLVWQDDNADGLRQANEKLLPGIKIEVYDIYNDLVGTAISDDEGNYFIDHLKPKGYYLKVYPPEGLETTSPHVGSNDISDSDVDHSHGKNTTDYIMMLPGAHLSHVDFGLIISTGKPHRITDFNGSYKFDAIELNWEVEGDENISYYQIEKRHESEQQFKTIGKQPFDELARSYGINDYDLNLDGSYIYRLMSFDQDGHLHLSKELKLEVPARETDDINIYPNPAVSDVNLTLTLSVSKLVTVDIYDTQGVLVKAAIINQKMTQGVTNTVVNLGDIPLGAYNMQVQLGDKIITKRLILLNN